MSKPTEASAVDIQTVTSFLALNTTHALLRALLGARAIAPVTAGAALGDIGRMTKADCKTEAEHAVADAYAECLAKIAESLDAKKGEMHGR